MSRIIELFSANYTSPQSVISRNTNILRYNGSSYGSNSKNALDVVSADTNTYEDYLSAVERLKDYRNNDLSETILDLYTDAVFANIDQETEEYISIKDNPEATKAINNLLKDLDIVDFMKSHSKDFIYYGSYTSELVLVKEDSNFKVKDLRNPFVVIENKDEGKYLIKGDNRVKKVSSVIRLCSNDLELLYDPSIENPEYRQPSQSNFNKLEDDEDDFYIPNKYITGRPLFLSVEMKVKEYITKDLIIAYLGLMQLIEQDTYTIDVNRLSDMDSVVELCERIKNMIVNKDDYNLLTSAKLDKDALIYRLFDNTRVIPSVANNLSSLTKFQDNKVDEKRSQLINEKEQLRDEILTTIGFPRDLYAGSTNKWEVNRQSDRYNLKLTAIKDSLIKSVINLVLNLAKECNYSLTKNDIKVIFIKDSISEVVNLSQKVEANNTTMRSIGDIIDTASNILKSENIQDKSIIEEMVKTLLSNINPLLSNTFEVKEENHESMNQDNNLM